MKIWITKADTTPLWIARGLAERESIAGLDGAYQAEVQTEGGLRRTKVAVWARGNRRVQLAFTVTRHFETEAEAFAFWFTHPQELFAEAPQLVSFEYELGGSLRQDFDGAFASVSPRQIGLTVITSYNLVGSGFRDPTP